MGTIPKVPVTKKGGLTASLLFLAATAVAFTIWTHSYFVLGFVWP